VEQDLSDVNEEGYVEVDSPAAQADMFDVSEDELLRQKDAFLESIAVRRPPGEPPVALKLVRSRICSANAKQVHSVGTLSGAAATPHPSPVRTPATPPHPGAYHSAADNSSRSSSSWQSLTDEAAKNKVGEALYLQIAAEEPELAGKLTGMFLQARAPQLPRLSGLP
jgi:hypothetical protein